MTTSLLTMIRHLDLTGDKLIRAALRPHHITAPQLNVLRTVSAADATAGITSAEIARDNHITPQTSYTVVSMLRAAGLVADSPKAGLPGLGRSRPVILTDTGRDTLAACETSVADVETQFRTALASAGLDRLDRALAQLTTRPEAAAATA